MVRGNSECGYRFVSYGGDPFMSLCGTGFFGLCWASEVRRLVLFWFQVGWGINIPDVEQVKVAPNLRYYTITGLKPSRDYVISLRAYNVMGNGFPIYETVRTTSIGAAVPPGSGIFDAHEMAGSSPSETPVGVRADAISSSAIRVTWTDPEMDVPYSRQYTVRYSSR